MLVEWKGRLPYEEALTAQRARREARQRGEVGDVLWLLEHDPVITTGRRPVPGLSAEVLAPHGYGLCVTERGGLATCHEPGQLVGYLLMDAGRLGPRRTVESVEEGLIRWLAGQGVVAGRRCEYPGVWLGDGGVDAPWLKIASIGLHFQGGFTLHGFALNLRNDLRGFSLITPCGITDARVTSLERWRGAAPTPEEAALEVGRAVVEALAGRAAPG